MISDIVTVRDALCHQFIFELLAVLSSYALTPTLSSSRSFKLHTYNCFGLVLIYSSTTHFTVTVGI